MVPTLSFFRINLINIFLPRNTFKFRKPYLILFLFLIARLKIKATSLGKLSKKKKNFPLNGANLDIWNFLKFLCVLL